MRCRFPALAFISVLLPALVPAAADAQAIIRDYNVAAGRQEQAGSDHWLLIENVELEGGDTKLHADHVEVFTNQDRVIATGNVVVTQGENRIAADRADFNTRTKLGTFYDAYGIAAIKPGTPTSSGGFAAPQMTGQETDVYFFGEVVEKVGERKYKISDGGFSTCVQPTPRWDLHAGTITLEIDSYTFLRNAVLRVKGVPLMYLPVLYYPTKEEERATGFLLPTYGMSSLQGQEISNKFFWAINRSHDATLEHNWFSKNGQGYGGEYRYNLGSGDGTLRSHLLDQRETTYFLSNGTPIVSPATRSYQLRGGANQTISRNIRARAYVDYFSSVTANQTFFTDLTDASRSQRRYGGNLVGGWRSFSLNATYDRTEYFRDATSSSVAGTTPRVSFSRSERPLFRGSPIYFSFGTDVAQFAREEIAGDVTRDTGLERVDVSPQIRFPFKRWQWFTVSTALAWRETFYTRSDADPGPGVTISNEDVRRRFFTLSAQAVGPVFVRVWDTPDSGYAERFKHTVEPYLNVTRTSSIDNFSRIVVTEGGDGTVGNATNMNYGLRNRFYAKRRTAGRPSQAQEIVSVEVSQTYYTDQRSVQYDRDYTSTHLDAPPSHFSPVRLSSRVSPANAFNATVSAEFDARYKQFRDMSVNGTYNWAGRLQSTAGWTKRFFIADLPGWNNPDFLGHYLNASTNVRTANNRYGTIYEFYYNLRETTMVRQSVTAFFNAQCCGIAMQYHRVNYGIYSPIPTGNRFFLSVTLAGLGNFSPFSGAMAGVPR